MKKLFIISAFLFLSLAALAQSPLPWVEQPVLCNNGQVCSNGFVYTYQSGTLTPLPTFTDYTLTTQNSNPVLLNASGFPTCSGLQCGIWLSSGQLYKVIVKNSASVQQYVINGVSGSPSAPTVVRATQDFSNNTTPYLYPSDLRVTLLANVNYAVHCEGVYSQATGATEIAFSWLANSGLTAMLVNLHVAYAVGPPTSIVESTYTALGSFGPTVAGTANTLFRFTIDGVLQVGTSNVVNGLGFEPATGSVNMTIKQNTSCTYLPTSN